MTKKTWFGLLLAAVMCVAQAAPVIHKIGFKEGLKYLGDNRNELMDLYYPADWQEGEVYPGIVIIHGGGWSGGIRNAGREINIGCNLARMGYVCISIDYQLSGRGRKSWPTCLLDCKTAVQWLRVNADKLHLDSKHIGCIGGSAGGHLSALLAMAGADVGVEPTTPYGNIDTSIQACVNLYGIMDLFHWRQTQPDGTPIMDKFRMGGPRAMMGTDEVKDRDNWLKASPMHQVDKNDCPVLQVHGKIDTTVDWQQVNDMKAALDAAGVENEAIFVEGAGHTFDLQTWQGKPLSVDVRQRVLSFYDRHLKGLSAADSAVRYAALKEYEATHTGAGFYGSRWFGGGKVAKVEGETIVIVQMSNGKPVEQACQLVPGTAVQIQIPKGLDYLKEGMRVEGQGKTLENHEFALNRIVIPLERQEQAVGRVSIRGPLHMQDDVWTIDAGRRSGVFTMKKNEKGITVMARQAADVSQLTEGRHLVGFSLKMFGETCILQNAICE